MFLKHHEWDQLIPHTQTYMYKVDSIVRCRHPTRNSRPNSGSLAIFEIFITTISQYLIRRPHKALVLVFCIAIHISSRIYIERTLQPNYTIQCILCHMVFYGIEATFLLTFLMNEFTNTLISTLYVRYILHPSIYAIKYCHE
jgi:hypothetical protein